MKEQAEIIIDLAKLSVCNKEDGSLNEYFVEIVTTNSAVVNGNTLHLINCDQGDIEGSLNKLATDSFIAVTYDLDELNTLKLSNLTKLDTEKFPQLNTNGYKIEKLDLSQSPNIRSSDIVDFKEAYPGVAVDLCKIGKIEVKIGHGQAGKATNEYKYKFWSEPQSSNRNIDYTPTNELELNVHKL